MDLNLYPVFLEILHHGSVTRAAESLGLTQAATSNALARLRAQLDDPLFVRTSRGMLPTHFALEIQPRIELALQSLQTLAPEETNDLPNIGDIDRHFRIVMSDLEEALFLPDLVAKLAVAAPGISIEIQPFQRLTLQDQLERGSIDFLLAHLTAATKNVISRPLAAQTFACVTRKNNSRIGNSLDLDKFVASGHILITPDKGSRRGVVDDRLKKLGKSRTVVCSLPHFLPACLLAAQSDHLLTLPRRLGEQMAGSLGLKVHDLPFDMPGFMIGIHWHQTRDRDPEHTVFRNFVIEQLATAP
jgi:DNA-binding transcriptional LysR family regulator